METAVKLRRAIPATDLYPGGTEQGLGALRLLAGDFMVHADRGHLSPDQVARVPRSGTGAASARLK